MTPDNSEEFKTECLAKYIANMQTHVKRREFIDGMAKHHPQAFIKKIETLVRKICLQEGKGFGL